MGQSVHILGVGLEVHLQQVQETAGVGHICYCKDAKTKCHCNSRICCTALGANFICNKCKKQLELDDICYCKEAKTKCHCNSRNCCTALGANFICNKCKKQLELDDICYCDDAKAKCHCNSRNCCTVTLKERGKFT
ncbi:hypothetical protein GPALN_014478 [Globodera pallida]|nr:hypothetical protein GPALN_014478 [Globodera pallida]